MTPTRSETTCQLPPSTSPFPTRRACQRGAGQQASQGGAGAFDRAHGRAARGGDERRRCAALRSQVRQMKEHVLRSLPDLLEQLETNVTANGGTRALGEGGRRRQRIVVEIARKANVQKVVKAKSMATEEVHLNQALQAAGDEGRGDRPGRVHHPACRGAAQPHRRARHPPPRRGDFRHLPARTGHAADARPAGDLQRGARGAAQGISRADMGISGCNFAIAETGTCCIVTNEGNGRMTSTLPRVYVVVMGIEKLVPTIEDAFLQYQALCRSATGQQCSVYLSMTSGPRAAPATWTARRSSTCSCSTTGASTCWRKATARRSAASAAARVSTSAPSTVRSAGTPTAAPTAARSAR
jgi:L-lactate dehydrogenase complex protein LldF